LKNSSLFGRPQTWLCRTSKLLFLTFLVYSQFVSGARSQAVSGVAPVAEARNGIAGQPQHYSRKQLRILMANAANPDDYQLLASYFRRQELVFRNKAQRTLDDYASYAGRYPMATKFVTRAEVAGRLYKNYISKADENARLAAQYEESLAEMGIEPERESATIVSVKSLQSPPVYRPSTALLENLKRSSAPPDRD
jgi:hypothetical protein